jgi:hypothetical protein
MLDPRLTQTCPKCRQLLIFVAADDQWRFYHCGRHRTVVLSRFAVAATEWGPFRARLGEVSAN